MRARFVILANGILTTPKLARIAGMEKFAGESFHTSRWDYNIDLRGKTVGIIGTGATAVQAVPELAKIVGQLYVFQRPPSSIDVRHQRATTDEERATWANEPGWARARRARFSKISAGRTAIQANDDYLAGKIQDIKKPRKCDREPTPEELTQKQLDSNFRIMEQIRARVDAIVKDSKTAAALKPYYPYGCKRAAFHAQSLPGFHLRTRIGDVRKESEDAYAEHCRDVDIATAPLRDCISYYNGEGNAAPGSLAYYGGGKWHKHRVQAQSTLEPYACVGGDPAV